MYTHAKRSHTHVKDPVVHVRNRWIMVTAEYPACTKKCQSLENVEVGQEEDEEEKVHFGTALFVKDNAYSSSCKNLKQE